jgi:enoyl-[acyl-carrier protein] reductase III
MESFFNKNYWALILGGSSGLGLGAAKALSDRGMNLLIVHQDTKTRQLAFDNELEKMRRSGVAIYTFNQNALKPEIRTEIAASIKEILMQTGGTIRLMLHAIARGNLKKLHDPGNPVLEADDFAFTIQAMGTSLWDWAQCLIGNKLFATDARILALTSAGSQKPWPGYAAVGAAKATLESLGRSMALELAPLGIRTNLLQPGVTETPALALIPGNEQLKEEALKKNPLGRLTTPVDVGNVVCLLCTDEAAWINGAIIPVDGGENLR